jgi:uncharacterized protein with HEPN domain
MNDRSALEWLRDARSYAVEAHQMALELDLQTFYGSRRDQLAVRYCLAIVGEALSRVPKEVQSLASEISWDAIYGLRNRLVHGFWLIDYAIILRIPKHDTMTLVASIDNLIAKVEI